MLCAMLTRSLSLSLCHFYFGQTTWLPSKKSVPAVTQGYFCCSAATSAHCCAADIASECVSHSADTGFRPAAIVAALCPSSASAQCCKAGAPPTQLSISIVMPLSDGSLTAPAELARMIAFSPRIWRS